MSRRDTLKDDAGFADVNLHVEQGGHWDSQTWADFRKLIMPYLQAGWSAP